MHKIKIRLPHLPFYDDISEGFTFSSSALHSLVAINSTQNKFDTKPIRSNIPLDFYLPYSLLFIFCHFSVVTFLVRRRSVVPNLTFLLTEFLEFRRDKASNITE